MSDTETFSHAARLGGLRPEVINRFVATQAAVHVLGPPNSNKALRPLVRDLTTWLRKAKDEPDAELRRRVLLMVTEGRRGQGWPENEVASRIRELAEDVYNSIA
ncbi:hypothetical protein [Prauserella muralis]|uniref:Uncharacterized protein n=1 Tax=Prauserella muralis TaxID=588067 RepID=A0A2V4API0_9PSEU|nr:hypothetical protein [Prauserella muralis]PXY16571.1 hypothetical protein BAY60_35835 [Prauserella muralis]TWE11189.1 hypothetical protein FHX69_7408 [Prauserella muralis]